MDTAMKKTVSNYKWATSAPFHRPLMTNRTLLLSVDSSIASKPLLQNVRVASLSTSSEEPSTTTTTASSKKQSLEFQAETRQLLDIVTHSLYTDKEVFLRELISNASDALEKLRHLQTVTTLNKEENGTTVMIEPDTPLEIRIVTDEANGTLTITDTGIGLSREDMISHLGTIARSGSKAFVQEMSARYINNTSNNTATTNTHETDISRGIIGKFGVGFYSAFMVGDKVEVRSK